MCERLINCRQISDAEKIISEIDNSDDLTGTLGSVFYWRLKLKLLRVSIISKRKKNQKTAETLESYRKLIGIYIDKSTIDYYLLNNVIKYNKSGNKQHYIECIFIFFTISNTSGR